MSGLRDSIDSNVFVFHLTPSERRIIAKFVEGKCQVMWTLDGQKPWYFGMRELSFQIEFPRVIVKDIRELLSQVVSPWTFHAIMRCEHGTCTTTQPCTIWTQFNTISQGLSGSWGPHDSETSKVLHDSFSRTKYYPARYYLSYQIDWSLAVYNLFVKWHHLKWNWRMMML